MNKHTRRFLTVGMAVAAIGATDAIVDVVPGSPVGPRALAAQEDPESEEFRDARRAISRGQFDLAVDLMAELRDRYPEGQYAAQAAYWQAFSHYRMDALREALTLLEIQLADYPEARIARDSRDLELRIRSQLAERGDARAAERVLRQAEAALAAEYVGQGGLGQTYVSEAALAQSQMVTRAALLQAEMAMRRMEASGISGQLGRSVLQEGCEEEDVQSAALQALMQIETERAVPILRQVLERQDECSVPLRKQAIFVLSQHDPSEIESLMIQVATSDADPEVQEAAVFWLSQVGSDRALDALADVLSSSDDPRLQENAIFALSQQGGARAGDLLEAYALDGSKPERVREKAIFWLSQQPDRADAAFLIDLYNQLDSETLKEGVFLSLSHVADAQATDWMLDRALDRGEPVELRKQALFWAGQQSTVELSRLNGLYAQLEDREMKEQLIFLYAQRPEAEAIDQMIEIVRNETDAELRKRAIFWLGRTGDERAVEFLLDLVGDPPQ